MRGTSFWTRALPDLEIDDEDGAGGLRPGVDLLDERVGASSAVQPGAARMGLRDENDHVQRGLNRVARVGRVPFGHLAAWKRRSISSFGYSPRTPMRVESGLP